MKRIHLSREPALVDCIALSPDGTTFLTGGRGGKIIQWDATTGQEMRTVAEGTAGILVLTFSPDGKKLAWTTFVETRIVEWPTLRPITELPGTEQQITTTAFSPDGTLFALPGHDNSARLSRLDPKSEVILPAHKDFIHHVSFSPDGKTLATVTGDQVKLWHVDTHRELLTLDSPLGSDFCKFSPDGKTLAAGSRGGIQLWRAPYLACQTKLFKIRESPGDIIHRLPKLPRHLIHFKVFKGAKRLLSILRVHGLMRFNDSRFNSSRFNDSTN